MKRVVKKKVEGAESAGDAVLRALFRSFAKLAEQAASGRPQLRGVRVARDPNADRFVVVHLNSRVEFVMSLERVGDGAPPQAEVQCRPMDSAGVTAEATIARFRFSDAGVVTQASVAELIDERIDQPQGAWSIVAAVMWQAMLA